MGRWIFLTGALFFILAACRRKAPRPTLSVENGSKQEESVSDEEGENTGREMEFAVGSSENDEETSAPTRRNSYGQKEEESR